VAAQSDAVEGSGGGKGEPKGAYAPGGTLQEVTFGGSKIWKSKIWPFWRIGVCIADIDIFTPS